MSKSCLRCRVPALPLALALVLAGSAALAEEAPLVRPEQVVRGTAPDLASPLRLRAGEGRLTTPLWTDQGLWPSAPQSLPALRKLGRAGPPAYDPRSRTFFASAEGTIVELRPEGRLRVVAREVQGLDIDVRSRLRLAVSREPDHRIVLHRLGGPGSPRRVLLVGERFFAPRFSPDGNQILVSESRAAGGHFWLLDLDGQAVDLGQGYSPVWHPDGKRIIFSRIAHDGERLTDGDLWILELASRRVACLGHTPGLIEVEPALSPDGRWLAFKDGRSGDLYLARFPSRQGGDR
jgi:hypothetical protein